MLQRVEGKRTLDWLAGSVHNAQAGQFGLLHRGSTAPMMATLGNRGGMEKAKRQAARSHAKRGEHGELDSGEVSELVPVSFMGRAVLVVESDPEEQAGLARSLSRRGNRVVGTGSGDGALALVSQWDVDLVLISDTLPGRSGVEVTRLIHKLRPNATVVLMSEQLEPATRVAARAAGASECVRKPVSEEQLAHLLRQRSTPNKERGVVAQ
jgi:CheY-like chemotaxis protein